MQAFTRGRVRGLGVRGIINIRMGEEREREKRKEGK